MPITTGADRLTQDDGLDQGAAYRALGGVGEPPIKCKQKLARAKAQINIIKEWMEAQGVWEMFLGDFPNAKEWFK